MITRRTLINLVTFAVLTVLLVVAGVTQLILSTRGGGSFTIEFADSSGLTRRNDVSMRGVPVGSVGEVELTPKGTVVVEVLLDPGVEVPQGSVAEVTRRSPIGDLTIELNPGDGPMLGTDDQIPMEDTIAPPDAGRTIEVLAQVLRAVPSEDLDTVVTELATAVRGRGEDLASLAETTADLPEEILTVRKTLEALITTGPDVTGVLADHSNELADDITQTAILADILRDNRFDLVELSSNARTFAEVAADLIISEKANLACLISDLGDINAELAEPQNLQNLAVALDTNHFFFNGVEIAVRQAKDGFDWFRVFLLPHQEPPAQAYEPNRPPPDVFAGNACHSRYGAGVGPGTQPGPVWLANGSTLHPGQR